MKKPKIKNTAEFLLNSGLLFEINRTVLHPKGLALEIILGENDEITFGDIWDYRDDPEGIVFDEEAFLVGKDKFDKFMKEFGEMRHQSRLRRLGFIIQEEAQSKHDTDLDIQTNEPHDTDPEDL